jgi:uncharacterized protein (TIGR01777 family)
MSGSPRVLVTGGSGLIGRAATAELAAAGFEVVVLSRRPERVRGLPAGARAAGWDGRTAAGWAGLAAGAAGVVHLAGESIAGEGFPPARWTAERKRRLRASRVESTEAVVQAIAAAGVPPRFLLQGSAVGFYGAAGDEVVTEDHPPGAGFLPDLGVEWEGASAAVEGLGVRRAILRTGIVLARDGGALPRMALPFRLFVGGPMGSGRQVVPWIHLADAARAIRFLAERDDARGPFNLAAPHPATNAELSRAIARVLGRPNLFRVPGFALRLAVGELADSLLTGQRAVPRALERLGFRFRFPELEPALRDLLG